MCNKAGSCIVSALMSEYTGDERIYNLDYVESNQHQVQKELN